MATQKFEANCTYQCNFAHYFKYLFENLVLFAHRQKAPKKQQKHQAAELSGLFEINYSKCGLCGCFQSYICFDNNLIGKYDIQIFKVVAAGEKIQQYLELITITLWDDEEGQLERIKRARSLLSGIKKNCPIVDLWRTFYGFHSSIHHEFCDTLAPPWWRF